MSTHTHTHTVEEAKELRRAGRRPYHILPTAEQE